MRSPGRGAINRAVLAPILFAVALAEVFIAIAAGIASDRGWSFLLNHFVVTNAVIGGSLAIAGWPIAWQRPRNLIGWLAEDLRVPARPGQRLRVRITNTDNGPMQVWASGFYRLLAIDGADVNPPSQVSGRSVTLTAGARADIDDSPPHIGSLGRLTTGQNEARRTIPQLLE